MSKEKSKIALQFEALMKDKLLSGTPQDAFQIFSHVAGMGKDGNDLIRAYYFVVIRFGGKEKNNSSKKRDISSNIATNGEYSRPVY